MVCLSCGAWGGGALCPACLLTLEAAVDLRLAAGAVVHPALWHRGAARVLVHRLKYQGLRAAAGPLARAMAGRLSQAGCLLVPVPRVPVRKWRYGIDPAVELARALGAETGRPVVHLLRPPWWSPPHAGRPRNRRGPLRFSADALPAEPGSVVLVDDVLTSGATLSAAYRALGVPATQAVTATVSERFSHAATGA